MPEGTGFEGVDISTFTLPATVTEVYSEASGGYVFKLTTSGYGQGMVIMCGVDASGTVTGAVCTASSETLGYEKTFGENFKGVNDQSVADVDTISGATKTTAGYKNAIKDALNAFTILNCGSVDLRTEEEILAENLSTALPAGEGSFTPWFMVEELTDISSVYVADNGNGYVFVVGEAFIGVGSDGTVVTEVSEELKGTVTEAYGKIAASQLQSLDLTSYEGIPSQVVGASVTATGNFVLDLKASGYGIRGDKYIASGEYIYIKVSVTPEGRIIACETVSQAESNGFGAACAEPWFYNQFSGKDETTYTEVDAINGSTFTTNGYMTAISKVFDTVKILTGGEQ
jgi:uncharacterized protein with FMN-binding domain